MALSRKEAGAQKSARREDDRCFLRPSVFFLITPHPPTEFWPSGSSPGGAQHPQSAEEAIPLATGSVCLPGQG